MHNVERHASRVKNIKSRLLDSAETVLINALLNGNSSADPNTNTQIVEATIKHLLTLKDLVNLYLILDRQIFLCFSFTHTDQKMSVSKGKNFATENDCDNNPKSLAA